MIILGVVVLSRRCLVGLLDRRGSLARSLSGDLPRTRVVMVLRCTTHLAVFMLLLGLAQPLLKGDAAMLEVIELLRLLIAALIGTARDSSSATTLSLMIK